MLYLLQYAYDHSSTTITERTELTEGDSFLDLLAVVYLAELNHVLQQGLVPAYQAIEGAESHIRGRLNVQRQVQRQGVAPTVFECDFEDHTYDTPLNQTVLYAAVILSRLVTNQSVEGQLRAEIVRLRDRVSMKSISIAEAEQIKLSRLTEHYSELLQLANLVIAGTFIDAFDPGIQQGVTTLLDMNRIYEQVVERCARSVAQQRAGWEIRTQATTRSLLSGSPSVDLRPDFVIDSGNETVLVGDAKWKTSQQNNDIYQIVAYELAEEAPGLLVYPSQDSQLETKYQIRGGRALHLVELPVAQYVRDFESFTELIETAFESKIVDII